MTSRTSGSDREHWSGGRGFAAIDPERQREVVGYVRPSAIETMPAQRFARPRGVQRLDWTRVQPDRDSFEGSSSRRGR
ncbi:hypothetical protein H8N03_21450 [Ramlibacter sp. USB13]|uniref:Uncharacterized protein n=1 Tax=Ramlibacter cellulosilyticus TaxID=2764187 RepID=A0A923MUQ0_9BURK|nr:hypothetical protein [Ramlibacter cellulosilyticus]MBC5785520.1 hypothetical protein [Ramlibacter cellulosilyticus]